MASTRSRDERRPLRFAMGALTVSLAAASCSETERVFTPFAGDAYSTAPVAWPAVAGVVTDSYSDTLSILNLASGKRERVLPIGRDPLAVDGPHHITTNGADLFVPFSYPAPTVASGPHASHGSSTRAGYLVRVSSRDGLVGDEVRLDENPGDVAYAESTKEVLVTHFDLRRAAIPGDIRGRRANLAIVNDSFRTGDSATLVPVCVAPHGMAVVGTTVYIACYGEDALAALDLEARTVTRYFIDAPEPESPSEGPYFVMAEGSSSLLLFNTLSKSVVRFDVTSKTFGDKTVLRGAPFAAALSAGRLFVPLQSEDSVAVLDPKTLVALGEIRPTKSECQLPHEVTISPEGVLPSPKGFLVCEGDHVSAGTVVRFDPTTLQIEGVEPVGVYPDRLLFFKGTP